MHLRKPKVVCRVNDNDDNFVFRVYGLGFRVFILLEKRPSLPSVVGGNDLLGASIYSYDIPTP